MSALRQFQCHKTVKAVKIASLWRHPDGSAEILPEGDANSMIAVDNEWMERYKGGDGDRGYYVVYEDGYASWSPSKVFEEGYRPVGGEVENARIEQDDYFVASIEGIDEFNGELLHLLRHGWTPCGAMIVTPQPGTEALYTQMFIRFVEPQQIQETI